MTMDTLTALCPLDGRYQGKVADLGPIFSEYGLIRFRVQVEAAWLQALADEPGIPEVAPFAEAEQQLLAGIVSSFLRKMRPVSRRLRRSPTMTSKRWSIFSRRSWLGVLI